MSTYQQMAANDRPIPGTCVACGRYTPDLRYHQCAGDARPPWNALGIHPIDERPLSQRDEGDETA